MLRNPPSLRRFLGDTGLNGVGLQTSGQRFRGSDLAQHGHKVQFDPNNPEFALAWNIIPALLVELRS